MKYAVYVQCIFLVSFMVLDLFESNPVCTFSKLFGAGQSTVVLVNTALLPNQESIVVRTHCNKACFMI